MDGIYMYPAPVSNQSEGCSTLELLFWFLMIFWGIVFVIPGKEIIKIFFIKILFLKISSYQGMDIGIKTELFQCL